jgi:sec-independent protein translocase protein TatC
MSDHNKMDLLEHVGEFRRRILWVLAVLVISMIAGLFVAEPVLNYLKNIPPASRLTLNAFSPWDSISIFIQVAFLFAAVVTLPFALLQAWLFIGPGLREDERKAALRYIPGALLLFVAGLSFAYFIVFPMAFHFTSVVTQRLGLTETYGIAQYFSFMFNILLPMALLFELPVVVMFLTRIRVLNPKRLQKLRRYAYLLLIIVATMVTPPDFISDILVAVPLILLYEFSVMLSGAVYRKQLAQDQAWEEEYGDK